MTASTLPLIDGAKGTKKSTGIIHKRSLPSHSVVKLRASPLPSREEMKKRLLAAEKEAQNAGELRSNSHLNIGSSGLIRAVIEDEHAISIAETNKSIESGNTKLIASNDEGSDSNESDDEEVLRAELKFLDKCGSLRQAKWRSEPVFKNQQISAPDHSAADNVLNDSLHSSEHKNFIKRHVQ